MGNMAAYFASQKAKEKAAMAPPALPPIEAVVSPVVENVLASLEATPTEYDGDPCPHCGKPLKAKGRHFHIRSCHVP